MKNSTLITGMLLLIFATACSKDDDNEVQTEEVVLYQTNFSENDGKWHVGSNGEMTSAYENGQYVMRNGSTSNFFFNNISAVFTGITSATGIEASIKPEHMGDVTFGTAGLVFNFKPSGNEYDDLHVFMIHHQGYWQISKYSTNTGWTNITGWTISDHVRQNDFNKLRVELKHNRIHLYLNGTELYSLGADNNMTLDMTGLYIDTQSGLTANHFKAFELK